MALCLFRVIRIVARTLYYQLPRNNANTRLHAAAFPNGFTYVPNYLLVRVALGSLSPIEQYNMGEKRKRSMSPFVVGLDLFSCFRLCLGNMLMIYMSG